MAGLNVFQKQSSFVYDFKVDGGAIGTINTGAYLPSNALITKCWIESVATLVGSGATIEIEAGAGPTRIINATAITAFPTTATVKSMIPGTGETGSGLNPTTVTNNDTGIFVSVGGEVILTIAAAAITAGQFNCVLEYYVMPD